MEEKKLLKVDTATSDKIAALQSIFQLLGWVALLVQATKKEPQDLYNSKDDNLKY